MWCLGVSALNHCRVGIRNRVLRSGLESGSWNRSGTRWGKGVTGCEDIGSGWSAIIASAITGTIAAGAILLVTRKNIHAAKDARVWTTRRKAYTAILSALHVASERASVVDGGYNGTAANPIADPHGYDASDEGRQERVDAEAAWRKCRSAYDARQVIVSDDFKRRFEALIDQLPGEVEYDNMLPPEFASLCAQVLADARGDLLSIAREEFSLG